MVSRRHCTFAGILFLTASAACQGQDLPFLTEAHYRYLVGEISGDAAYEHIRFMTQFHRPRGGHPGLMKVAEYYESKAREYGLENVKLIRQRANYVPWHAKAASLWMIEPEIRCSQTSNKLRSASQTTADRRMSGRRLWTSERV